MNTDHKCPTNLISDEPADKDLFGGAHEKLAQAIFELVTANDGGKTIGLEGKWGSGKSTVIKLLGDKLDRNKNTKLFNFDAWAHKGDPLRRTFLEQLIIYFQKEGWVNEQKWNINLDVLAKRLKRTKIETRSQLSTLAKTLIVTLFLVPIGTTLLSLGIKGEDLTSPIEISSEQLVMLGIGLSLLPIIISLIVWAVFNVIPFFLKWVHKDYANIIRNKYPDPFKLIAQEFDRETTTKTTTTPEPTSVEFEDTFSNLVLEAFSSHKRKVVIVLDNLDRIPA